MKIFSLKKLKTHGIRYFNKTKYLSYYEKCSIDDTMILLESQQGKNLNGNIFYILKELLNNSDYRQYNVSVAIERKSKKKTMSLLRKYSLCPNIVYIGSKKYFKLLSSAKYLVTDTSFLSEFIKKEGQILLNVWHGTPLKTLGKKDNSGLHSLGNVQKNFVVSDYLLYPSEFMMNHMIEDYMLENICSAKCLLSGYPRNEAFFHAVNENIVEELEIQNKKVIGYMPTWRGTVGRVDEKEEPIHVMHYLFEIDKRLTDEQILLVNLHPFVQSAVDYSLFKHIKPFPREYETYEVLNICDVLVTDYSSVFFDFANTGKKIILFMYDLEEYLHDRGLYMSLESLPFPIVHDVKQLINEINLPKNYDDQDFLDTYCKYDSISASSLLLKFLLKKEKSIRIENISNNGKDNILIYAGNLAKNGITTALFNLLNNIDLSKHNYYITFTARQVAKHKEILRKLPEGVNYISMLGKMNASIFDKLYLSLARKTKRNYDLNKPRLQRLYSYEIRRCFANINFSNVIQYNGYEFKYQMMFGYFEANKIIFVHNNMIEEIRVRGAQNPNALNFAYNHYDKVVMVTEDMKEPTLSFCHDDSKLTVINNIIDYQTILLKSKEKLKFDNNTESSVPLETIEKIFNSKSKIFVTIGRFSPEKGHERMLRNFNKLWLEDNNIYLIIIGGHGVLFEKTLNLAASLEARDHIVIIKSLTNPYPFLKRCDYFVFTSFHEGFGLVLAEADILGVPVMSTDILGPKGFLEENNGLLVHNNDEGIYLGMRAMLDGKVQCMNVDYSHYNRRSVGRFESLLEEQK